MGEGGTGPERRRRLAQATKLGRFEVRTPDVQRLAAYYKDSLGLVATDREAAAVYLATGADHHCVVVASGGPDGRARIGFEVLGDVDGIASAPANTGISVERRRDHGRGVDDVLILDEPWSETPIWLDQGQDRSARGHALEWGPGRDGAGRNIFFTYHRHPDGNLVELFSEINIVADDRTGEYEPRPWHETWPQYSKVWSPDPVAANKWGPVNPDMPEH